MSAPSDLHALITRCLDGVATDADQRRLDGLVASDPEVARALARAARLESALEVVVHAETVLDADAPERERARPAWRPPRSTRWAAGAGALAAASLAVLWWWGRAPGAPSVATRASAPPAAAPARAVTAPPAAASSAPFDMAPAAPARRVHFADGSRADLRDATSRLETRVSTAKAIDVALLQGGARFEVVARPERRFRVWVAATRVDVIGTVFTIDRLASGARVTVERGVVQVSWGDHDVRLQAGASEVVPADPAPPARSAGEAADEPRPPPPPGAAEEAPDEPRALLRASEKARRAGRPQEAASLLQRLLDGHPRDPRAAYAAFILGRVLLDELGRPRESAAAFARVEALDPRTPLVQDALAREVECWSRAGDLQRARQRAGVYLARYPDGRRAEEVRRYIRAP